MGDDHAGRKSDHIDICLGEEVRAHYNHWDDISLVHQALPEIDLEGIDLAVNLFGKELKAPVIISAMTGGTERAELINRNLAWAAQELGIGFGVGSQRAAVLDPALAATYELVKEYEIPLVIGNLGAPQLVGQTDGRLFGAAEAENAIEMVGADILAIHLNFLQEVPQPEGDTNAAGCLDAIRTLTMKYPILAKETGAGISRPVAEALKDAGVKGIDVGGLGGTSFSAVEVYRARSSGDGAREALGRLLWDWGIPTPVSLAWSDVGLPLIGTGGVRHGLDAAKAIALGASAAGLAYPLLKPAMESKEAVRDALQQLVREMRAVLFLCGAANAAEMRECGYVAHGKTREWLEGGQ